MDDKTHVEKKLKFRSVSTTVDPNYNLNRVEDMYLPRPRSKSELKHKLIKEPKNKGTPSLFEFLRSDLMRGYVLENDEEHYSARREKVYSFIKIPREVEKFMVYGFMQCADSFLFVCTFLPIRFLLAVTALITRPIRICFGGRYQTILKPAEICDILKVCIITVCAYLMSYVDTSIMYHLIKSQSVIKLYIFYNMLEVADRLFSSFGQDVIDALFWTSTEPRGRKREHFGVIPHLAFAIIYVFLHAFLVLCQATTLNVAINSSNKALLTIMISNNFVELKGSVFRKFDKYNLFQVACSDVRERFHMFILLLIVVVQTMKEYAWSEETLYMMAPDCLIVMGAEIIVDWIKHAFITRFNELSVAVYRDYTLSLAYDLAQTREKNANTDHSDLVARRMGFIPLPLGVVMVKVFMTSVKIQDLESVIVSIFGFISLISSRILANLVILALACILIDNHQQEKENSKQTEKVSASNARDIATSPIRPSQNCKGAGENESDNYTIPTTISSLGPAAIFSNSTVSMNDVCLNEEVLRVGVARELESIGEDLDVLSRSEPNIQQPISSSGAVDAIRQAPTGLAPPSEPLKKAESEPCLVEHPNPE